MASVLSAFPSWWSYLCVLVCVDMCVLCMSRWTTWESRAMTEWPSWLKNSTLWNWSVCLAVSFLCCVHCWSVSARDQSSPQAQCEIRQWFVHWLWLEDFWLLCGLTQADVIFSQCVFCDLVRLLRFCVWLTAVWTDSGKHDIQSVWSCQTLVCYMIFLWLTAVWIHKADVMWCLLQYCQTLFIVLFAWIDTARCNAVFTVILSDWCVDWQGKRAAFVTSKRTRNTPRCDYYSRRSLYFFPSLIFSRFMTKMWGSSYKCLFCFVFVCKLSWSCYHSKMSLRVMHVL